MWTADLRSWLQPIRLAAAISMFHKLTVRLVFKEIPSNVANRVSEIPGNHKSKGSHFIFRMHQYKNYSPIQKRNEGGHGKREAKITVYLWCRFNQK